MNILNLPIKKKWFDMIVSGEKPEEYREIKDYWVRRFVNLRRDMEFAEWDEFIRDMNHPYGAFYGPEDLFIFFGAEFKKFDAIKFTNGYGKNVPSATFGLKKIKIDTGKPGWGAEPGKYYFVLQLRG